MFSNDRRTMRQPFFDVWRKHLHQEPLVPLEQQLLQVILMHPEYHDLLSKPDHYADRDYLPENGETNPFFHIGLHMSVRDQIATDRPAGIKVCYQQLIIQEGSAHEAEHCLIDCLAETLWQAQRYGTSLSDEEYLKKLKLLLR